MGKACYQKLLGQLVSHIEKNDDLEYLLDRVLLMIDENNKEVSIG